jgi:nucleotide-binding universal stress UspA family protein
MLKSKWSIPIAIFVAGLLLGFLVASLVVGPSSIRIQDLVGSWEIVGGAGIVLILLLVLAAYAYLIVAGAAQAAHPSETFSRENLAAYPGQQEVQRVLVSAGGGSHAQLGLRLAVKIMDNVHGHLTLLRVVPPSSEVDIESEIDQLHRFAAEILGPDRPVHAQVTVNRSVLDAILEEAKRGYDLLIVGESEESGPRRWLSSTIPDRIVERAPCSVVIVHQHGGPTER